MSDQQQSIFGIEDLLEDEKPQETEQPQEPSEQPQTEEE